jgi:hypothetical protein
MLGNVGLKKPMPFLQPGQLSHSNKVRFVKDIYEDPVVPEYLEIDNIFKSNKETKDNARNMLYKSFDQMKNKVHIPISKQKMDITRELFGTNSGYQYEISD